MKDKRPNYDPQYVERHSLELLNEFCSYYTQVIIDTFGETEKAIPYISELDCLMLYISNRLAKVIDTHE